MKTKTVRGAALIAALSLTTAACGVVPEAAQPTVTVTESTSSSSTSSSATPDSANDASASEAIPEPSSTSPSSEVTPETVPEQPDGAEEMMVGFGETFEWEDGTKVLLTTPVAYSPDEYAAGGEGYDSFVKITVTITNGSGAPLDASFSSPTVTSGVTEGSEIFDETVGDSPMSSILPGRTITFDTAYGVDDPSDIVAEFAPTWDHDAAYWQSSSGESL